VCALTEPDFLRAALASYVLTRHSVPEYVQQRVNVQQSLLCPGQGLHVPNVFVFVYTHRSSRAGCTRSILSPGQGWYRSAKAQNSTGDNIDKSPPNGQPPDRRTVFSPVRNECQRSRAVR
jgi:hypothetical protein